MPSFLAHNILGGDQISSTDFLFFAGPSVHQQSSASHLILFIKCFGDLISLRGSLAAGFLRDQGTHLLAAVP